MVDFTDKTSPGEHHWTCTFGSHPVCAHTSSSASAPTIFSHLFGDIQSAICVGVEVFVYHTHGPDKNKWKKKREMNE